MSKRPGGSVRRGVCKAWIYTVAGDLAVKTSVDLASGDSHCLMLCRFCLEVEIKLLLFT